MTKNVELPQPIMMKIDGEIVRVVFHAHSNNRLWFTSYQPKTGLKIGKHELPAGIWNSHHTDRTTYYNSHSYRFLSKDQEVITETQTK